MWKRTLGPMTVGDGELLFTAVIGLHLHAVQHDTHCLECKVTCRAEVLGPSHPKNGGGPHYSQAPE